MHVNFEIIAIFWKKRETHSLGPTRMYVHTKHMSVAKREFPRKYEFEDLWILFLSFLYVRAQDRTLIASELVPQSFVAPPVVAEADFEEARGNVPNHRTYYIAPPSLNTTAATWF